MMAGSTRETGRRGEEAACEFLRREGHTIVERNWRSSHLETDIITSDKDGIHFVEVKTRNAPVAAESESNITRTKRLRMVRAAQSYLHGSGRPWMRDKEVFFDVVTVVLDGDSATVEYYPQAFIPTYV